MLATQAINEPSLKIIATSRDENIFYQALVIAGDNMDVARGFLKFLKSNDAKLILKQHGFLTN
jgi:ABC-type molybdate transport system substrate-binding protein